MSRSPTCVFGELSKQNESEDDRLESAAAVLVHNEALQLLNLSFSASLSLSLSPESDALISH